MDIFQNQCVFSPVARILKRGVTDGEVAVGGGCRSGGSENIPFFRMSQIVSSHYFCKYVFCTHLAYVI